LIVSALVAVGFAYYGWAWQTMPQAGIYFLDDIPLPQKGDTVLIFAPHPDDETIGVGGFIYEAVGRGANVRVVLVTNGNKHGLEQTRYAEFKKAMSVLGVTEDHLIFLNYQDGELKKIERNVLKAQFTSIVDIEKPNIIIANNPNDIHPDHSITGIVAGEVAREKSIPIYEYLVHYPNFPKPKEYRPDLYLLPPLKLVTFDHEWRRLMLQNDALDVKYEALLAYRSQLRNPFLRSVLLGLVRRNELLSIPAREIEIK